MRIHDTDMQGLQILCVSIGSIVCMLPTNLIYDLYPAGKREDVGAFCMLNWVAISVQSVRSS